MPTLLALFPLGSEVRQFGHSGLLTRLIEAGWRVHVVSKFTDADLRAQMDSRIEYSLFPEATFPFALTETTTLLDKAHAYREARHGRSAWKYTVRAAKTWKQSVLFRLEDVLGKMLFKTGLDTRLLQGYEQKLLNRMEFAEWNCLLDRVQPDLVLTNLPRMEYQMPCWITAKQRNIPVVLLYHTWKDINAAGRLNFPFHQIGVWNEAMKSELLRQNPRLSSSQVQSVGCTHFASLGSETLRIPEKELRQQIGVEQNSPLILYCAAAPWVVVNESRYIVRILEAIQEGQLPQNTQVVVRTNPMDHQGELASALRQTQAKVAAPDWHWNPQRNWCYQRHQDQAIFNSLLKYAHVCVGLPSTISIECAITRLPVVNIGFQLHDTATQTGTIADFWNADFYTEVRLHQAALLAENAETMINQIGSALQDRSILAQQQWCLMKSILSVPPEECTDAAFQLIQKTYAEHSQC